ncbi:MAG: TetR/AcrR family transcriptional regulator [Deltaproteobacteria bacterium]|nr:TetR/AcrR family transcriptional regulator [Deltaproteobacteria bacterium]
MPHDTGKGKKNEKYFRIIDAATRIFAQKGFFNAKVSEIAGEAGVADGTIYIYFENKDDILISLFEEQMQTVLDNMVTQLESEDDPAEKLKTFALVHLRLIQKSKDMAEIIQVELRQSSKFMKEYENKKFAQYLDLIGDIVREGQEQGVFDRNVIPGVAKRAFFGALDEMSRFWVLSSRKRYDIEVAADQISSFFLKGIQAGA